MEYILDSFEELGFCKQCNLYTYAPKLIKEYVKKSTKSIKIFEYITYCMKCNRIFQLIDDGNYLHYLKTEPNKSLLHYFNLIVIDRILHLKNNHLQKHLYHGQYKKFLLDKRINEIKMVYQLLFDYKKEIGLDYN